jgi:hypothetical protein
VTSVYILSESINNPVVSFEMRDITIHVKETGSYFWGCPGHDWSLA